MTKKSITSTNTQTGISTIGSWRIFLHLTIKTLITTNKCATVNDYAKCFTACVEDPSVTASIMFGVNMNVSLSVPDTAPDIRFASFMWSFCENNNKNNDNVPSSSYLKNTINWLDGGTWRTWGHWLDKFSALSDKNKNSSGDEIANVNFVNTF